MRMRGMGSLAIALALSGTALAGDGTSPQRLLPDTGFVRLAEAETITGVTYRLERGLPFAKTLGDLAALVQPEPLSPSAAYRQAASTFVDEHLGTFITMESTMGEFRAMQTAILACQHDLDLTVALLILLKREASFLIARNPQDYLEIMALGVDRPARAYKLALAELIGETVDAFHFYTPSKEQIKALIHLVLGMQVSKPWTEDVLATCRDSLTTSLFSS